MIIGVFVSFSCIPLNAELNPICHLLALLGGATIIVVSRLRVKLKVSQRGLGSHRPHGRVITECNGTRAESRFGLPAKRTSPLMLLVVFILDSDYSPSSVTTNNINGLVRFAGRLNLLSARVPLHSVFTLRTDCFG